MSSEVTISGTMRRPREMPDALMAISSLFSPSCPITITQDISTASGMAVGRMVQAPHIMNSTITQKPRPLPTSSSM